MIADNICCWLLICIIAISSKSSAIDDEWPNCQNYQESISILKFDNKKPMEEAIDSFLTDLKSRFEKKLVKMEESYIAQLSKHKHVTGTDSKHQNTHSKIERIIKDHKEKIEDFTSVQNQSSPYYEMGAREAKAGDHEGLRFTIELIQELCNEATRKCWIELGIADQAMKAAIAEIEPHVDHQFKLDDLFKELPNVHEEVTNTLFQPNMKEKKGEWMDEGRKKAGELFSKTAGDLKTHVGQLQAMIIERTKVSDEIALLVDKMNEAITDSRLILDRQVVRRFETAKISRCPNIDPDHLTLTKDEVIECLGTDSGLAMDFFKRRIQKIIDIISVVNHELEVVKH